MPFISHLTKWFESRFALAEPVQLCPKRSVVPKLLAGCGELRLSVDPIKIHEMVLLLACICHFCPNLTLFI